MKAIGQNRLIVGTLICSAVALFVAGAVFVALQDGGHLNHFQECVFVDKTSLIGAEVRGEVASKRDISSETHRGLFIAYKIRETGIWFAQPLYRAPVEHSTLFVLDESRIAKLPYSTLDRIFARTRSFRTGSLDVEVDTGQAAKTVRLALEDGYQYAARKFFLRQCSAD